MRIVSKMGIGPTNFQKNKKKNTHCNNPPTNLPQINQKKKNKNWKKYSHFCTLMQSIDLHIQYVQFHLNLDLWVVLCNNAPSANLNEFEFNLSNSHAKKFLSYISNAFLHTLHTSMQYINIYRHHTTLPAITICLSIFLYFFFLVLVFFFFFDIKNIFRAEQQHTHIAVWFFQ